MQLNGIKFSRLLTGHQVRLGHEATREAQHRRQRECDRVQPSEHAAAECAPFGHPARLQRIRDDTVPVNGHARNGHDGGDAGDAAEKAVRRAICVINDRSD